MTLSGHSQPEDDTTPPTKANVETQHTTLELALTVYENTQDTEGVAADVMWEEFAATAHEPRGVPADTAHRKALNEAKDGDCVVLGRMFEGKSRAKRNLEWCSALGLDFDARTHDELAEALGKLMEWEFWAYSTHKHEAEVIEGQPRIRVIVPFARRATVKEYEASWRLLAKLLGKKPPGADYNEDGALIGGPLDPKCCDASRLHFLPTTYDMDVAWSFHNPGGLFPPTHVSAAPRAVSKRDLTSGVDKVTSWLSRINKASPLKAPARALLAGEEFDTEGERHDTMLALTWMIALKFPDLAQEHTDHIFEASYLTMWPGEEPDLDSVWAAYEGAVERIERDREEDEEKAREKRAERAQQYQSRNVNADGPYEDEELAAIASKNKWPLEALKDHWIIQRAGAVWLLGPDGDYKGPYPKDDAQIAASKILARAPLRMVNVSERGNPTYRPFIDVVREAGSIATEVVASLSAQRHSFDWLTGVLTEACTPLRPLEPLHDPLIEEWIHVLGGEDSEKLLDWMAICPDLDQLLCAIYFGDQKGVGKSLFAHGMAKLWTPGGPSALDRILGNFNGDLVRCPLIFADEKTTANRWQQDTITEDLREMVSVSSRPLRRLYVESASLNGCIRLILAANNENLLKTNDTATARDMEAIAERFLYISCTEEAERFMLKMRKTIGKAGLIGWKEGKIAQFALWLQKNRDIPENDARFAVEGSIKRMHRILLSSSPWNSMICEWLVRYLDKPNPVDNRSEPRVRRVMAVDGQPGQLLVNAQAIIDGWKIYMSAVGKTDPQTSKITIALKAIAQDDKPVYDSHDKTRIPYWRINLDILKAWSENNLISTPSKIEARFVA